MAIRILHVVTYMGRGGLETMLMNYYRHIDRSKVQFDFLVHRDFEADYDNEIKSLGGRIYRLPRLNPFSRKYLSALNSFFKEHPEYSIVHSHLDCMSAIPLKYAAKHGVKTRIAHAHNSEQSKDAKYIIKLFYKNSIPLFATHLFACGDRAGKWMFGGKAFSVLNNAVNTEEYLFDPEKREKARNEFELKKDQPLIIHIGRFAPQKNHRFLIKIFSELVKSRSDSRLLLVGDGELFDETQALVKSEGIENNVIFAGIRADISYLLQAADVFILPSLFEGLPVSVIEAQASGIPCIISDKVPIECKKTDLVTQLPLDSPLRIWSKTILQIAGLPRKNTYAEIKQAHFDINENTKLLEEFYIENQSSSQKG